ncbi:MAG: protein kinase [Planctomycetes bacterium]|jgi:serine/threonine protein kinase|nr:protein kinase [Planctomycetota bacterium]
MASEKSSSRIIVACPHCKARFDVTSFKPGSKIKCGSCRNILRIPDRQGDSMSVSKSRPVPAPAGSRTPAPSSSPAPSPSSAPPPPRAGGLPEPGAGTKVNNEFELLRLLGQGGYGSVYEAVDLSLKRRVAIKLMLREKTTKKEFVEKFLREARTAALLSHPNIVKIHHVGFCRELQQHFLAMEYVEGRTLSEIMSQEGAFSVERAVDVITQSANGLAAAHQKNIIHRDIKPGNIMITPKGVVKITDFGLAKVYDPSDKDSTIIGTPYFMPPEQFEGKARDGRTDIYSLGVTFYYLLTLKRPFDGRTPAEVLMNVMRTDPAPLRKYTDKVPEAIEKIVFRMMARRLDERFASCDELLRALKALRGEEAAEEKVFCPSCGYGNDLGAERCSECSTSLLTPCPVCSTPDFLVARFCGNCGADLAREREVAGLLREAQSYVASGRLPEAVDRYAAARQISPENSMVVEGLRQAEQAIAEREGAVARLKALMTADQFARALPLAEEAAEKFPGFDPISELLKRAREGARDSGLTSALGEAKILAEAGNPGDAAEAARKALELDPVNPEARDLLEIAERSALLHREARDRAARLEAEQDFTKALDAWKEALAAMPADEAARQAVARIEGLLEQADRLRGRAAEALLARDLPRARAAIADALAVLPGARATTDLEDRLLAEEKAFADGLRAALSDVAAGRCAEASTALADLAARYPQDVGARKAGERARALCETAAAFLDEAENRLAARLPALAEAFVRAATRVVPDHPRAAELLARCAAEEAAQVEAVSKARALLDGGDAGAAAAVLAPFGGAAACRTEIVELARRISKASPVAPATSVADPRQQAIAAALAEAREALAAGKVQDALASCQKALRVDRNHEEARSLKAEIDAVVERAAAGEADSRIETGLYPLGPGAASPDK